VQPVRRPGARQQCGDRQLLPAPLYRWLCAEAPGLLGSKAIKWNFTKFLVGKDGQVVRGDAPQDAPAKLAGDIEAALAA